MKNLLLLLSVVTLVSAEIIKEEFDQLSSNWWVSRWGNIKKQYDESLVTIEDGILKLTMEPEYISEEKHSGESWYTTDLIGTPRARCAEITYTALKFLYGSFRASIKSTDKSGGVVGWFVYKDGVPGDGNLHEIDVEYLTEDLTQVHFTLHHDQYSTEHQIIPVNFDPSEAFHEYRFDWHPDSVVYYIDGERITSLTTRVPDDSTQIMLNWWSNNDTYWGGAMPDTTTHMWVDYMHYLSLDELDQQTAVTKRDNGSVVHHVFQTREGLRIVPGIQDNYTVSISTLSGKELTRVQTNDSELYLPTQEYASQAVVLSVVGLKGNQFRKVLTLK